MRNGDIAVMYFDPERLQDLLSFAHSGESEYERNRFLETVARELETAFIEHPGRREIDRCFMPGERQLELPRGWERSAFDLAIRSLLVSNPRNPYRPSVQDVVERLRLVLDSIALVHRLVRQAANEKQSKE